MMNARHQKSKRTEATFTDWVLGRSLASFRTVEGTNRLRNVSYRLSAKASCVQVENYLSASSKTNLRKDKDEDNDDDAKKQEISRQKYHNQGH